MTLSPMIGMDGDLVDEQPRGRLAPIRTPIGSEPEKATMQLLHQTCRSRIDRLNAAGVIGGSSGKYGAQQRFSASTRRPMSSVRQKRCELLKPRSASRAVARAHLVEVAAVAVAVAARRRARPSPVLPASCRRRAE